MSDRQINVSERGDVVIITLGASVDASCDVLQQTTEFLAQGRRKFLLNLGAVRHIDSAGLAQIVWSHLRITQQGGRMKMLSVPARVLTLLEVTRLISIFEKFASEEDGLKSFETASDAAPPPPPGPDAGGDAVGH
jgi:anti-sigma B factor antagonist